VARDRARHPVQEGDIVEHGEEAEEAATDDDPTVDPALVGSVSLGIGSLGGRNP
jgi:hypothetical protein